MRIEISTIPPAQSAYHAAILALLCDQPDSVREPDTLPRGLVQFGGLLGAAVPTERFAGPVRPYGVTRSRIRPAIAAVAALGTVGALLLLAEPASACSCAVTDVDEAVKRGWAAAVVTNRASERGDREPYVVEAEYGADLPARIAPAPDPTCGGPAPMPGFVEATLVERKDTWRPLLCGYVDFGDTVLRALGEARAVDGGRAVAVAAGTFGGSRLVALDRQGRAVAWDGQDGTGLMSAACPGGSVVASVGRTGGTYDSEGGAVLLSVHDATTLGLRRSVPLDLPVGNVVTAMRCADRLGSRVEVLVQDYNAGGRFRSLTVTGKKVTKVKLGKLSAVAATPDGFISGSSDALTRLSADGTRTEIVRDVAPARLAVSRDGRTIAVHGSIGEHDSVVGTLDARSGKLLGEWRPPGDVSGLAFSGSGRLLVRLGTTGKTGETELRSFDRAMQPLGKGKAGPGRLFTAVGESGVIYQRARLNAVRVGEARLIPHELRLAGAEHVVALSAAGFTSGGKAAPSEADDLKASVTIDDEDASISVDLPLLGAITGGVGLTAAALFGLVRRRRTEG